jgi:aldose 1-epimerase
MPDVGTASVTAVTRSRVDGLHAITLRAGSLEATFVAEAGMAGVSLRQDGTELLAGRERLTAYVAAGTTMGIPFLHPWANRLSRRRLSIAGADVRVAPGLPADEHGLPIHGLLPRAWSVHEARAGDEATLRASLDHGRHPAFPFPHTVEHRVELGAEALTVETTLRASGPLPVPVSFGSHPYLRLPGVAREAWTLRLPVRRRLVADDRGIPTGETVWERAEERPLGRRRFDDGYDGLGPEPAFGLAGGDRSVTVRFLRGYPVAQVFAPCDEHVVCFEPMTAPTDALVSGSGLRLVPPGQSYRAAFEVRVG